MPGPARDNDGQALAAVIRQALQETKMPSPETFAQDLLDVLAVEAGLKPAAAIGFGYPIDDAVDKIIAQSEARGMATGLSHPWRATCDAEDLPSWYADTLARLYASTPIHIVAATPAIQDALMKRNPPLSAQQESTILGYPICCVTEYHRRRHTYHVLTLGMLARQVDGNEDRMKRLVQSGVQMSPKGEAETTALLQATRTVFAPCTSISMCDACSVDTNSPAMRLSARFRVLAKESGLSSYLTPH